MIAFHPNPVPCQNCGTILQATYAEENQGCCPDCGEPACYICGCTEFHPCSATQTNADQTSQVTVLCSWVDWPATCSLCFWRAAYEFYQEAVGQPATDTYYLSLGRPARALKSLAYGV